MSADYFLLIKFDNRQRLIDAAGEFDKLNQITSWDAVDGHYSFVLKIKDDPKPVIAALKSFDDSLEHALCEIIDPANSTPEYDEDASRSYIFIEAAQDKIDNICNIISNKKNIISCQKTKGNFDIVAIIQDENFSVIENIVNENIRLLDGVLRIKQDRIIALNKL